MKHIKILGAFLLALLTAQPVIAADDELYYALGGGLPIGNGATNRANTTRLGAGVSWNTDLTCGNFDINTSITNQLNGVTGAFQNLMSSVVSSATGAVSSLPALAIQRLNPALYDLLQNGVLQASEEFHLGEFKCEEVVKKLSERVKSNSWDEIAKGGFWRSQSNTAGVDILNTNDNENSAGLDNGVAWIGGSQAAGRSQPVIRLNRDVTIAGFDLLLNRSPTDTSAVSAGVCSNAAICTIWTTPVQASNWVTDVLGDKHIRTCEGCPKVEAKAGMGIQRKYEQERLAIETELTNLVNATTAITASSLRTVQGAQGFNITRPIIEAIREEEDKAAIVSRLSGELALSRTLEKALLARRVLLAGTKEPNVAINEVAQEAIGGSIDELNKEIQNMLYEIDIRKKMASNTTVSILNRHRIRRQAPAVEMPANQTIRDGAVR